MIVEVKARIRGNQEQTIIRLNIWVLILSYLMASNTFPSASLTVLVDGVNIPEPEEIEL